MQKKPYPWDSKCFFEADLQTVKASAVEELLSVHGQFNHHTHDYSWKVLFLNAQSKDTVVFMSKLYCDYYFEVFCNDVMCVGT